MLHFASKIIFTIFIYPFIYFLKKVLFAYVFTYLGFLCTQLEITQIDLLEAGHLEL